MPAPCRFWQQGNCRNGNSCPFLHESGGGSQSNNRFAPRNNGYQGNSYQSQNQSQSFHQPQSRPSQPSLGGRNELPYSLDKDQIITDLASERPQWILSAYGPGKYAPAQLFGGEAREKSFEEMRLLHYMATAAGIPEQAFQEAKNLHDASEQQIQTILNNVDGAMNYIIEEGKKPGNRLDVLKSSTGATQANPINSANAITGAFGAPSQSSAFGAPSGAFGQPSSLGQKPSAFGQPSGLGQASTPFGQPSSLGQKPNPFGQPSALGQTASPFGQPSSLGQKPSPFGAPSSAFGAPSQLAATGGAFGQPSSLGQNANAFGAPSSTPNSTHFGAPAATTSAFGQPSAPAASNPFGQPAANPFGGQAASTSAFGAPSQPAASHPFGAPSQPVVSNPFGGPSQPAASNPFGASSQPAPSNPFGQPQTNGFPAATQQPFGVSSPSQANPFGAPSQPTNGAASAASNPFGSPSTNQPNPFNTQPPPPQPFGNPNLLASGAGAVNGQAGTHRDITTYASKDGNGNLTMFKGKRVIYDKEKGAGVKNPDGSWSKIWFPTGTPRVYLDTQMEDELYDDNIKAAYQEMSSTAKFPGGTIPLIPPKVEWSSWEF